MFQFTGQSLGIESKIFGALPIRDVGVQSVSGEIDKVSVIVLSEEFVSSCGLTESPHQFRADTIVWGVLRFRALRRPGELR
jgi:hypothetical protein